MTKLINDALIESNKIEIYNSKALQILSNYLNNSSDFIKEELVKEIVNDCKISEEYSYALLLSAACGLNIDDNYMDKELFHLYFLPMIHQLNPKEYQNNPYYRAIKTPNKRLGKCDLKNISYKPYEAFVYNDLECMMDGRILPQIGFFSTEFTYPALLEDERIWMTITPNELETMKEPIERATGNVLTYGLGLGYFTYMVSEKSDVSSITVVELNEEVIEIFQNHIRPQFKHASKIKIVKDDAFNYAEKHMAKGCFDFVFTDLWHDVSDGLDMFIKMKEYEKLCPNTKFSYWIEKSIQCYL